MHHEGPPRLITLPAPPKRREMVSSAMHLDPVGSSQSRYVETEPTVEEKDEDKDKDKNCDDQSRLRPRNGIKTSMSKKKGKKENKEPNQSDGKQLLSEEEEVSEQQPG